MDPIYKVVSGVFAWAIIGFLLVCVFAILWCLSVIRKGS